MKLAPLVVAGLLLTASLALLAPTRATSTSPVRVVVAYNGPIPLDVEQQLEARGATLERRDDLLHFIIARTHNPDRLFQWSNTTDAGIRHVEIPSALLAQPTPATATASPSSATNTFPNDPYYWREEGGRYAQWSHHNIRAHEAWATTMGNENVLVAIVDGGVDSTQPVQSLPKLFAVQAVGARHWL